MHNEMDDYIYILIGLLWLVFTFYVQSKKQKKKRESRQSTPRQSSSEKPRTILEQLFTEEISPEPDTPVFDDEFMDVPVVEKTETITFENEYKKMGMESVEEFEREKYHKEAQPSITDPLKREHETPYSITSSLTEEMHDSLEFDIRKAVIFAEILKRPYT